VRPDLTDVAAHAQGLIAILVPDLPDDLCALQLKKARAVFGPDAHLALTLRRRPGDALRLYELEALAGRPGVTPVVTNRVLFTQGSPAAAGRRHLHPREDHDRRCRVQARPSRRPLSEGPAEMARLFPRHARPMAASVEIAAAAASPWTS
jgi:error-prone DNA polymerase